MSPFSVHMNYSFTYFHLFKLYIAPKLSSNLIINSNATNPASTHAKLLFLL